MNSKALILHAWYSNPSKNWYLWAKTELEKVGRGVFIPELPTMNTNLPDINLQLKTIEQFIDKSTLVIGHSLGAVLGLKLAEIANFDKLFLVSGWDFDDLTKEHQLFWSSKIDHEKIKKNVREIYVISSDNDPYFTAFQAEEMSKRLNGKFILIKGAGHFTAKDGITNISQIVSYF